MLQDSLAASYSLSNMYEENRWKYQDAEDLLQAVLLREKNEKAGKRYANVMRSSTTDKQKKRRTVGGANEAFVVAEEDDEGSATDNSRKAIRKDNQVKMSD